MRGASSIFRLLLSSFLACSGASILEGKQKPQATASPDHETSTTIKLSPNNVSYVPRNVEKLDLAIMDREEKPEPRLVWPPVVIQQTALGYLRDVTGNSYPRDIGRSSKLSDGQIIFQFGDTFSHSQNGTYLGNTDNTFSVLRDELNPTLSAYQVLFDESEPGETIAAPMLMKNENENDTETTTVKLWSFTGTVEYKRSPNAVYGWTFYQKRVLNKVSDIDGQYIYTGIAQVISDQRTGQILTSRERTVDGPLELFGEDQPLFGDLCAVSYGKFIYLYGHLDAKIKDIGLARAPLETANAAHTYEFWNGQRWTKNINATTAIMTDMQHGQIFETDMFGRNSAYKWAFFGCNSFGDSKGQLGKAKAPEGPWEIVTLDIVTYALNADPSDFHYCMYPHPWAFDIKKGDLMVSWSEGGLTGGVLAAVIRFQMSTDEVLDDKLLNS